MILYIAILNHIRHEIPPNQQPDLSVNLLSAIGTENFSRKPEPLYNIVNRMGTESPTALKNTADLRDTRTATGSGLKKIAHSFDAL